MNEVDHDLVGQTLCERWHLVRLLGRGGMSAVYEARDTDAARVAVKVLREPSSRSPRVRQRFLREGRVASAVPHANAVRVLGEHETPDGRAFLVMELLEGRTLRAACDGAGRPLDVLTVLEVAAGVLDVLAAAHAAGVVHRDIKPENVFLTTYEEVKVLDFGIAAMRDEALDDASITQSGVALGTPAFMAPEQALGRHSHVDTRTDVWAVGATMFYCLTGRHVHEGASNAHEAVIFAATLRAPPLSKFRPDLDATVARIVDRALARDARDRWQSAEAMREAVVSAAERLIGADETARQNPASWTAETLDDPTTTTARRAPVGPLGWSVVGLGVACAIWGGLLRTDAPKELRSAREATASPPAPEFVLEPRWTIEPSATAPPPEGTSGRAPDPVRSGPPARARARRVVEVTPIAPTSPPRLDEIPDAVLDRRK